MANIPHIQWLTMNSGFTLLVIILLMSPIGSALHAEEATDALGDPLQKGIVYRLGTTRLRHWIAGGTCFTPDGKQLLSIGETNECLAWDVATGKLLRSLPRDSFPLGISNDSQFSVSWVKGELKVNEWPDGKSIHSIPLQKLQAVTFARDKKTLIALTTDHWVYRWDLASGKELSRRLFPLVNREYWVDPPGRLSPDGKTLAGVLQSERTDKEKTIPLRFWDVASGEEVHSHLSVARSYYDCRWSPDGSRLFALVLPYGLEVWDVKTGKKIESAQEKPGVKGTKVEIKVGDPKMEDKEKVKQRSELGAEIVEVTPDGQSLLLGMFGQLVSYDLVAGKTRWSRNVAPRASGPNLKLSTIISFSFSPVGKTVAVGCQCGHIALLDWTTGKDVEFSSQHPGFFNGPVIFSKDGASMLITDGMTERLLLHDSRTGKQLRRLSANGMLAWSPDGKRFADDQWAGWKDSDPKYLLMKDLATENEIWKIRAYPYQAWFSPDGKSLTYWDLNDRTFHRVDADTGNELHVFRLPPEVGMDADSKVISPDWKLVAVSAKKSPPLSALPGWQLQVWEINGKKRWEWDIPAHWQSDSWNVRFLPGNRHLVVDGYSSEKTGFLLVLDAQTGKKAQGFTTRWRDSFIDSSPDGRFIVMAGKDATEFRNVATGQLLFQYKRKGIRGYLQNLTFSPNGKYCAFCTDDFTVEVLELESGKTVNKFHRPTYFFRNISFAPDSRTIALTFNDRTIWIWDTSIVLK